SPTGTPTGTVTFLDGATPLGSGVLANVSGVLKATFTTSALSVAAHTITAQYQGDGNFATSTSGALTQTVNQAATRTALVSNANPAVFGQSVTFTATVTATAPGSGVPTGTIQFKDGAANLGAAATLSNGVASLTTS